MPMFFFLYTRVHGALHNGQQLLLSWFSKQIHDNNWQRSVQRAKKLFLRESKLRHTRYLCSLVLQTVLSVCKLDDLLPEGIRGVRSILYILTLWAQAFTTEVSFCRHCSTRFSYTLTFQAFVVERMNLLLKCKHTVGIIAASKRSSESYEHVWWNSCLLYAGKSSQLGAQCV